MDSIDPRGRRLLVLEGMMIAGYAIGADEGIIYCRAEYPLAIERINKAIDVLKQEGLLEKPVGALRLPVQAESQEGSRRVRLRRRNRAHGLRGRPAGNAAAPAAVPLGGRLFQKPTIVNNVETMANVSHIMREGAETFSCHGHRELQGHQGLRSHRQGGEHRPRGSSHGHHASRDRVRHRRRHSRRQGVQGRADRRSFRADASRRSTWIRRSTTSP